MSKNEKRNRANHGVGNQTDETGDSNKPAWIVYLKTNWWVTGLILLLSIGALGAGLKYLEEDASKQRLLPQKEQNWLSRFNPFLFAPRPSPTPQLSKEYIYAGEKLLAVEDANASAAPPSDLAIWRPSTGTWWVLNGQTSQHYAIAWGTSGDNPHPGDYDGDGKTDFCIFRSNQTTNEWWIVKSSDWTYYTVTFGQFGDKGVPADYDGDGKTDIAVFRTGTWWIKYSATNVTLDTPFGQLGDLPAPKDFDGDGRADLAVWRNSNKTFYSHNSSNNTFQYVTFTTDDLTGEKLVPGDYDGDGRADYAVRNGTNWIIKQSSNNQTIPIPWQSAEDKAVQNDYDGDGKVDVAVWRATDGKWLIRQSSRVGQTNELREVQWGINGDYPVPAYYKW